MYLAKSVHTERPLRLIYIDSEGVCVCVRRKSGQKLTDKYRFGTLF